MIVSFGENQLRGALLEEAILFLLRRSGYKLVTNPGADPTLKLGSAGLEVRGRGAWHQIDAVSDFRVTPPFTNPQRLLVEGKCLSSKVGLPIIRNGVGVIKDVSENWMLTGGGSGKFPAKRNHYLYAIFSTTDFTGPAQDYAYAHDLPLLPLRRSAFFSPVINAINNVSIRNLPHELSLKELRNFVRGQLLQTGDDLIDESRIQLRQGLETYFDACRALNLGFITMLGGQFAVFLVAKNDQVLRQTQRPITVRVRWINQSWIIENAHSSEEFFSFDLPEELFELYAERGRLTQRTVANMKSDMMREFYAFHTEQDRVRLVTFRLDEPWFESVRRRVNG